MTSKNQKWQNMQQKSFKIDFIIIHFYALKKVFNKQTKKCYNPQSHSSNCH